MMEMIETSEWERERDAMERKIQNERKEYGPIEFIYAQENWASKIQINTRRCKCARNAHCARHSLWIVSKMFGVTNRERISDSV